MATIYTRAAKGSALTWTEGDANIENLNNDKIEAVSDDTAPSLGGDLNVAGFKIVSAPTSNGNIDLQADGTGLVRILNDGLVVGDGLTDAGIASNGNFDLFLTTNTGASDGEIRITAGANGDIEITPNGTGAVIIDGNEFPQAIGASGEVLTADGSGLVEWKLNQTISAQVYNADSVQINKGEPVYVFGAQGSNISVKRALNTGDSTSAQTLGLANENIAVGATGIVICQGVLKNVDTSTYTAGQALYLGATAGSVTTTKPSEPNHLVYLGFVETVNSVSGRIYVRVQNGYELEELHNVNINNATALANNHLLRYNSANTRWENAALDIVTDTTPQLGGALDVNGNSIVSASNGDIAITPNGTGKIVLDGLNWPTADGTANYVLKTDGAGTLSWTAQTVDTNTTYSISAETATGGVNLRLTGSDAVTDDVKLAAGSNITLTRTDANTITIAATDNDTNTTYGISAETATGGVNLRLTGSDTVTDDVKLAEGSNITITRTDANTITIASTASGGLADVVDDTTPQLGGNLDVQSNIITTSVTNGNINLTANGDGVINLNNDVTIGTGTGNTYLSSAGAHDFYITTDDGVSEPYIQLVNGANGGITIQPDGTGKISLDGLAWPNADGTNGQVLSTNGTGTLSWVTRSTFDAASPGAIGGTTASTGTFTTVTVNAAGELRLADTDSSNYVGFKAPGTVSTNRIWTLPAADGTSGQVLSTNGSGTLSWATAGGSSASIALLFCATSDLIVSNTASNSNVFGGSDTITEDYDPDGIVSVNGDKDIVLAAAGTYIYEVTSIPLFATAYGAGSATTQLTSPTAYFNVYNITTSTQLAAQDLDTAKHPGNGSSITYRANLGQIAIKVKIVTTTTNNAIRLRVTGASASSGSSTMRFGGSRPITFKITKVA